MLSDTTASPMVTMATGQTDASAASSVSTVLIRTDVTMATGQTNASVASRGSTANQQTDAITSAISSASGEKYW